MNNLSGAKGADLLCAEPKHTGDNASMIAYAAHVDSFALWPNDRQALTFDDSSLQLEDVHT